MTRPVVILAGGKGTRISEKTKEMPKPMLMIGDKPMLMHIIDIYASQGLHEFYIPVGYLSKQIFNYFHHNFDYILINDSGHMVGKIGKNVITIIDTGENTLTGGRIKRLQPYITSDFYLTYGDGLGNINLYELDKVHERNATIVTLTAVHPLPRFGSVQFQSSSRDTISAFGEKQDNFGWVNGGFMRCNPRLFNLIINGDKSNLESDILPVLAETRMLCGYKHEDFWTCIDTLRDLENVNQIYNEFGAEWLTISGKIKKY